MNSRMNEMRPPLNWALLNLGTIANYVNGRAFKKTEWGNQGGPIIRIQNLTGASDKLNRYDGKVDQKYIIRNGDLLFSWSATLDAHIYRGEEAVLNQHIYKVEPHIDKSFLFYLLGFCSNRLMASTHGSGMEHITKSKFENTPVLLPPLNEKHRIVAKIEELFTKLDAGAEYLKHSKRKLEQYRQSVLEAAFEGG